MNSAGGLRLRLIRPTLFACHPRESGGPVDTGDRFYPPRLSLLGCPIKSGNDKKTSLNF
jgi:hypothetical protein